VGDEGKARKDETMARCPICDAAAKTRTENPAFPFCSDRCKTIDLGKWLSEEYRVPVKSQDEMSEEELAEAAPENSPGGTGPVRH
jgi:endogenous inhibitor of DNA gyrase (YacG/DUF329 family)